jgi:hypothetical protein
LEIGEYDFEGPILKALVNAGKFFQKNEFVAPPKKPEQMFCFDYLDCERYIEKKHKISAEGFMEFLGEGGLANGVLIRISKDDDDNNGKYADLIKLFVKEFGEDAYYHFWW